MVDAGVPAPPGRTGLRLWGTLRRVSDRTPLRTKLITAVLALVIIALGVISVASVYMLRNYVTTQRDVELGSAFNQIASNPNLLVRLGTNPGTAFTFNNSVITGIQQPKTQLSWSHPVYPFNGITNTQPLPRVPTSSNWASGSNGVILTVPSQSGAATWRVMAGVVPFPAMTGNAPSTVTLVVGVNLGDISAMTHRLILFDLIVGGAIVIVLAAVGAAVIQTNLRPLNDIELTAGQIAKGHLNHRIPERDPRTEIGSLGQSLNTMLGQIENAFHAQEESEQAAHQSEERMRRFIADASHELRTPLTTIRGFAEYYRQRGGVLQDQDSSSGTDSGSSAQTNGYSPEAPASETPAPEAPASEGPASEGPASETPASVGQTPEGLTPEDLDRIMHRVEAEASRMGLLVEDLLQLARLDQQRPLDLAPVDLLTLAADTVQDARLVAPDRPIDLTVAPGAAFIVDGDEQRLRQVLANLMNNALTHTPADTPVRVRIASGTLTPPSADRPSADRPSADQAGGGRGTNGGSPAEPPDAESPDAGRQATVVPAVVLDVEDDGPGMTTEQAQRAFERFYRADQARNRASGGTGLGLAIVAGLVAAHGGTVSVRTAPGQGADFQVKLPLSPGARGNDDAAEPDDEESSATAH